MATKAEKMPKAKTCKACKLKFTPIVALQMVCSPVCAYFYTMELRKKKECLEALQSRRETKLKLDKLKTKSDWLKEAQVAMNRYVRARDYGKRCISCQALLTTNGSTGGAYDCGHWRSTGSAPHLRFYILQMAGQCKKCNRYLSGNAVEMERGLIDRLGKEKVEDIKADQRPRKYQIEQLERIKKIFNRRAKWYESRLNINN